MQPRRGRASRLSAAPLNALISLTRPLCAAPNPHRQASSTATIMKQMIAMGRVGAPEEAAGAMLLLASPYASYITGQAVEVTGGGWL